MTADHIKSNFCLSVAAISSMVGVFCLAGPAKAIDVSEAVRLALAVNAGILAQRDAVAAEKEGYVQAIAGYRPSASVNVEQRLTDGAVHRNGLSATDYSGESHTVTVRVTQPVYTGGRVRADVRSAMAQIDQAGAALRNAESDLIQDVLNTYVIVRKDEQMMASAQSEGETLEQELAAVSARLVVREATVIDQSQVEFRLAEATTRLARARGQLMIDRAHFTSIIGTAPQELEPPPELRLPRTLEEAKNAALDNNPRLQIAREAVRIAEAALSKAKAARMPSASLAVVAGDQPLSTVDPSLFARQTTVSLSVSAPILSGGLNSSRIRAAALEVSRRLHLLDQQRLEVADAVVKAWQSRQTAELTTAATMEQAKASLNAYRAVRDGREGGVRTTQDVLEAEQALRDAEAEHIAAKAQHYLAGVEILRQAGLLDSYTFGADEH